VKVLTRALKAEDVPMIFDSWLKSWRGSKYAGVIPNNRYYEIQRELIEGLVMRGATFSVAYPEAMDDVILGWACSEVKEGKTVLHYLYVKDPFLGQGITEALLGSRPGEKPGFITHKLQEKLLKDWRWVPEMARRKTL
jgi:hypothetical protein